MGLKNRSAGYLRRMMPKSIRARFSAAMAVAAALVFIIIGISVTTTLSTYTRSLVREGSLHRLAEARFSLELQAREIEGVVLGFSEWEEFYRQTPAPDPAFITTEFDPWLQERTSATAIVWVKSNDVVVASSGTAGDVRKLIALGKTAPGGVNGTVALPSGPAVVSIRPIIGDPPSQRVGMLAVARSIEQIGEPGAVGGDLKVVPVSSLGSDDRWMKIAAPDGYSRAATHLGDGSYVVQATLTGIDGEPSLGLEIARPDPWLGEGRIWIVVVLPIVLGLATIGLGHGMGVWLGNSVARPLLGFINYVQDQGYLALQGLRTDEDLRIDPGLPNDVAQLGHVIAELLAQLRVNQADLIEAGDQALAAERAFRTVVEESPELKILVREGVVEIANPAAAHFFGLQLGDLLRAEPSGLFTGVSLFDETGEMIQLLDIARLAGRAPVTARCAAADQPDRWIEFSVAFIDPEERDYVISARNITEERRLEALREEVLSLVSHDLRSPLTVVRGYLDILDKPLDDERRTKAVESARRSAQRMEDLLNDLLHATRAEAVFAPRVMRPVDISVLADGVATSLQMGAEQTILTSLDEEISVLGDPVRLEQALTNLIGNAIKHGPAEGEVRVGVHAVNGRAIVTVEDDGPGIPDELRETVFDRGARGNASQSTPGLGLGLYIVRVVAEAHGGVAYVDDSESGTRFVLDLPIVEPLQGDL